MAWPDLARVGQGLPRRHLRRRGSFGNGVIRISNSDPTILDWTTFACRRLGLPFVVENVREGMWNVRIRGGLEQQLRFHHLTDPAITRKRLIDGQAVKSQSRLKVVVDRAARHGAPAVRHHHRHGRLHRRRGGEPQLLRAPHARVPGLRRRPGLRARRSSSRSTCPEVLRAELARPSWKREHVALGTNTDPYQWVEGRYKLMRGIWEAMRDFAEPVLDPHEVAAVAARQGPAAADRRARAGQRVPVGADARREDVAVDRAAHAASAGAAGGGGGAQPDRHPDRDPDRAADARDQRRAGAGGGDHRAGRGGGGDVDRRPGAVPARLDARRLLRLAADEAAGPRASATRSCTATAPTSSRRSARRWRRGCPAGGGRRARRSASSGRRCRLRSAPPRPQREEVRQTSLF